jgi:hypothetical protein
MSREDIEEAIEVLEDASAEMLIETGDENYYGEAIAVLRQTLETEKQEPVAWRTFDGEGGYDYRSYEMNETYDKDWAERNPNHKGWVEPLYTAPPKQWVGLTDEDIHDAFNFTELVKQLSWDREPVRWCENFSAYIEAKLREKNT